MCWELEGFQYLGEGWTEANEAGFNRKSHSQSMDTTYLLPLHVHLGSGCGGGR